MLRLPWQPDRGQLRVFAGGLCLLLLAVAWRRWHHVPPEETRAVVAAAAGLAVLAIGLFAPGRLRGFYLLWLAAVAPLGWMVSYLLLGVLYFVVIAPIGLVRRLLGGDPLGLRRPPAGASLWHPRPQPPDFASYRRQA